MLRPAQCAWRHLNAQPQPSDGSKMTVEVSLPSVECSSAQGQTTACLRIAIEGAEIEAIPPKEIHKINAASARGHRIGGRGRSLTGKPAKLLEAHELCRARLDEVQWDRWLDLNASMRPARDFV